MNWSQLLESQVESAYRAADGLMRLVDEGSLGWRPTGGKNWMTTGQLLEHIEEAEAAAHRADTTVSVRLPDQAALHAFLHRLRSLGLEVTEVRRVPDPAKTPTNGEGVT